MDNSNIDNSILNRSDGYLYVISESMVRSKLKILNTNKASGPDGISNLILKNAQCELLRPLTDLFNCSLVHGKVPSEWLKAHVKPLFKSGRSELADNYRPVSLSSCTSKVMESIIKDFLLQWLKRQSPLRSSQHGFCTRRSCLSQMLEYFDDITDAIDRRMCVDSVYIDFSKAFDRVSHNILINKLHSRGIPNVLVRWVHCFLSRRTQRVIIEESSSNWTPVTSGVPQGTVLGPLLFSIFVDDIDGIIPNGIMIKKFADDTKIYSVFREDDSSSAHLKLQQTLEFLYSWVTLNMLPINIKKCNVMHFGHRNPKHVYFLHNAALEATECIRDLGLMLDSSMSFSNHVQTVVSKAQRLSGLVFRTFRCRRPEVLVPVFKALIRPLVECATPLWNPHSVRNITAVECVQRRFTKRIMGMRYKSYDDRLRCLQLPMLSQRRMYFDLLCMYKLLNGLLQSKFQFALKVNVKGTRGHVQQLQKLSCSTDCRKFFFGLRVVNHWNALPIDVVNSRTIEVFKSRLRNHLNLV
jgi:hypothetical protein